jgi:signal transduction histidine kinase
LHSSFRFPPGGGATSLNEARLEALLALSQMAEASLQEITDFALEQAVLLTRSQLGYLAFVNREQTVLTMHSWSRCAMVECRIADKPIVYPLETTGLWGEALRQRRPIITNDYAGDDRWKRGLPPGHVALRRHMNVPIFDAGRVVAVAGVGNKEGEYDESDVRQLTLLIDGMWKIVERQRTDAELEAHREHLERLVEERTAELNREVDERKKAYETVRSEREYLKHLISLQDRERQLIGFEIHDGLTQMLIGTLMHLESVGGSDPRGGAVDQQRLDHARELLRHALDEARRLISGFRSELVEQFGLVTAIEDLIDRQRTANDGVRVEFVHWLAEVRFPTPLENNLFRLAQEALTNACRHSGSQRVRIELVQDHDRLRLSVQDWGTGFDATASRDGRFGLESIRQRARLFGGQASIASVPGEGTTVTAELPISGGYE